VDTIPSSTVQDGDYDRPVGRCLTVEAAPPAPAFARRGRCLPLRTTANIISLTRPIVWRRTDPTSGEFNVPSILCDTCNHHQALKVALLAGFEPTSEVGHMCGC